MIFGNKVKVRRKKHKKTMLQTELQILKDQINRKQTIISSGVSKFSSKKTLTGNEIDQFHSMTMPKGSLFKTESSPKPRS